MAKTPADAVTETFPGATEEESYPPMSGDTDTDDFNRHIDKYDGKRREVALNLPDGRGMPMTVEALKQLTFDGLKDLAVVDASEALGADQFGAILENKDKLIGVPFVILHAEFHAEGSFGGFVTCYVLTQDEQRYVLNDGSTGIYQQLLSLRAETGTTSMIVCKHGLRVSEYDKPLDNGVVTHAKTYYIEAAQRVR